MKFERIQLGIKIGSLADEARRIRAKEQTLLLKATKQRAEAVAKHKNIDTEAGMPQELQDELSVRLKRPLNQADGIVKPMATVERIARKAIRRYLRKGLSREEILALPGVQASLRYTPIYESLRRHRKGIVRHEARHSQLALSFLRQRDYSKTEDKPSSYPNWDRVAEIAARFSKEDRRHLMQRFEQWRQEAHSFIRGRELMVRREFDNEPMRVG